MRGEGKGGCARKRKGRIAGDEGGEERVVFRAPGTRRAAGAQEHEERTADIALSSLKDIILWRCASTIVHAPTGSSGFDWRSILAAGVSVQLTRLCKNNGDCLLQRSRGKTGAERLEFARAHIARLVGKATQLGASDFSAQHFENSELKQRFRW